MNLIEQNNKGNVFAVAYQDNGNFYVNIINNKGEELDSVNLSSLLALPATSLPITGFGEPMITCCFIEKKEGDDLFISIYMREDKKQYHLRYSYVDKKRLNDLTVVLPIEDPSCTKRNFPIKSFYSPVLKIRADAEPGVCLTFYRQGHCSTVAVNDISDCNFQDMTDKDLGNMYLLFDQALVVRSSSSILFFKISEETGEWEMYNEMKDMRGNIYFIKGNIRIQVCTDLYIYFYMIDKETFEPTLENVMYNNMECSVMMFGSKVRFGVTFKSNQSGFTIYSRKYYHNFKVTVDDTNHEGAKGVALKSMNKYIIAQGLQMTIYDQHTFQMHKSIKAPGNQNDGEIEILHMIVSHDD